MMATDIEETRKESRIQHGDAVLKGLKGCPSRCTTDHSATVFLKKPSDHTHEKLSTPQIDIEKARTSVKQKAVEDMHAHVDKIVCEEISASSLLVRHSTDIFNPASRPITQIFSDSWNITRSSAQNKCQSEA